MGGSWWLSISVVGKSSAVSIGNMSSKDKDPFEKQDTTSKSSTSHSDNEENKADDDLNEEDVNKAEKDLEHLELQEHLSKEEPTDDSVESKPLCSPSREKAIASRYVSKSEPVAGQSGLGEPNMPVSEIKSEPVPKGVGLSDLQKENVEKKNIGTEFVEKDSDTTKSTSPFIQSSPTTSASSDRVKAPAIPQRNSLKYLVSLDSKLKSQSFPGESANTSLDVPDIVSEVASDSRESGHRDFQFDMERRRSESSDANLSEIREYLPPCPTPTSSISTSSSPSKECGDPRHVPRFQRKADERQVQSLGNLSPEKSEAPNVSQLGLIGDEGFYRRNVDISGDVDISDSSSRNIPDPQSEDFRPASEPVEALLLQRELDLERSPREENVDEESHLLADVESESAAIGKQNIEQRTVPSNRKKPSKLEPDSSSMEGDDGKFHRKTKPYIGKKGKMAAGKSKDPLQSSSGSTEPKSTSSDSLLFRESPDISSSGSSKCEVKKKEWQKCGQLYEKRYSTMSSIDSIVTEEADLTPPLKDPSPESMETEEKGESPERMETAEMGVEDAAAESKPIYASSDETDVSEAEEKVKGTGRKGGKCKRRGAKLSSSPPSDEMPSCSTKSRKHRKMRRTRHDSNDVPESDSGDDMFEGSNPSIEEEEEEETSL